MARKHPQELLDAAVDAVNAWLAARWDTVPSGPYMEPGEARTAPQTERLHAAAAKAVTEAVTVGRQPHTLITSRVACPGIEVVMLIADRDARAEAYRVEINSLENYLTRVRAAMHADAVAQVGEGNYGIKTEVAQRFGVRRATLDEWLAKAEVSNS